MKVSLIIGTILFVIGILIGMVQLWFSPWSAELFFKLEVSIGALVAILIVVWFVVKEYKEDKDNRSGARLD